MLKNVRQVIPNPAGAQAVGVLLLGLDATPTGSDASFDVVADFTGSTVEINGEAGGVPFVVAHSQTQGSTIKISRSGIYLVQFEIAVAASSLITMAIGLDNTTPGETGGEPIRNLQRILAVGRETSLAANSNTRQIVAPVRISQTMAEDPTRGIVRGLLTNGAGAGAGAATMSLPSCNLSVVDVTSLMAA